jgi:hypothetical protein
MIQLTFNDIDYELKTLSLHNNTNIEHRFYMHLQSNYILKLNNMQFYLSNTTIHLQKTFMNESDTVIKLIELHDERLLTIQRNSHIVIYNQSNLQNVFTITSQSTIYDVIQWTFNLIITTHSFGNISIWTLTNNSLSINTTCTIHNNSLPIFIIKRIHNTNKFISSDGKDIFIWKVNHYDLIITKIASISIGAPLTSIEVVNQVTFVCTSEHYLYVVNHNDGQNDCKLKYQINGCGCLMRNCVKAWNEEFVVVINSDNDCCVIVNVKSGNVVTKVVIGNKRNKMILMVLPLDNGDVVFTKNRSIKYINLYNGSKGRFKFEKEEKCIDVVQLKSGGFACLLNNKICILY